MRSISLLVFAILLLRLAPTVWGSKVGYLRAKASNQKAKQTQVTCTLQFTLLMISYPLEESGTGSSELMCHRPNGLDTSYPILGISPPELSDYVNHKITLSPAHIDHHTMTVHVADNVTVQLLPKGSFNRHLQELPPLAIGNRSVLALRVNFLDREPSYSMNELSANLFGPDNGNITMRSQFVACSFGKLIMNAAEGHNITNGVAEVFVNKNTSEMPSRWYAEQDARAAASRVFGNFEEDFDHVIFCMPPGIRRSARQTKWTAYAHLGKPSSFYNDRACLYVSVTMHEIGHNFGMGHSNYGALYGDSTGMMGRGVARLGSPRRCFNAEKNYLLGWYSDRTAEVDVLHQAWKGSLVGFPDYDKTEIDEVVAIRIMGAMDDSGDEAPLYVHWNRLKGINTGTGDLRDLIVTVKGYSPYRRGFYGSYVVHQSPYGGIALESRDWSYIPPPPHHQRIENFAGSGKAVVIDICSQEYGHKDIAVVSIHLDDGVQQSGCGPTMMPSSQPSRTPSASPSSHPPSSTPTAVPSSQPSSTPSAWPTQTPSSTPSQFCEDSVQDFKTKRYGRINCLWLSLNRGAQAWLCVEGQEAYNLCPDTCGKCIDNCEDHPGRFLVNHIRGEKTCRWLRARPLWQTLVCQIENHPARSYCQETCDSCPGIETLVSANDECEDSMQTLFHVNDVQGQRTCAWLAKSTVWKHFLCRPGQTAYVACAKTCERCLP